MLMFFHLYMLLIDVYYNRKNIKPRMETELESIK